MLAADDKDGLLRLNWQPTSEHWRTRYIKQLNLNVNEQTLLDAIYISSNNFINIDQCCLETLRLYIKSFTILQKQYRQKGTSQKESFKVILDLIARKERRYHLNSPNYKYTMDQSKLLYRLVLQYCENQLREMYGHKRKINLIGDFTHNEVISAIQEHLFNTLENLKTELLNDVPPANLETTIELNAINLTRWKDELELSEQNYYSLGKVAFQQRITQIVQENIKNPSLEMIYFELSKFLAPLDKPSSLKYYLQYVAQNRFAQKLVLKPLLKAVQKTLFENHKQAEQFEAITAGLIQTGDITLAIQEAELIFYPERKRISLDAESIQTAVAKHAETVEVLNEYLKDETDEITLANTGYAVQEQTGKTPFTNLHYRDSVLKLDSTALTFINLFKTVNFLMDVEHANLFFKKNQVMAASFIDKINEHCYDLIDDVLIENTDEGYWMNPGYYALLNSA